MLIKFIVCPKQNYLLLSSSCRNSKQCLCGPKDGWRKAILLSAVRESSNLEATIHANNQRDLGANCLFEWISMKRRRTKEGRKVDESVSHSVGENCQSSVCELQANERERSIRFKLSDLAGSWQVRLNNWRELAVDWRFRFWNLNSAREADF